MKYKFFALLLAFALCTGTGWADVKIDAANFPDDNFRAWVKENAAAGGDVLTDAQIAFREEMDISFCEIANLKGIEHFSALTELICWSNSLKKLDLSKNTALVMLRCNGNELTKLTLPKNAALSGLYCDQNNLGALDLSALPELRGLSCRYNGLKALDLSHNPELLELDCWGNEIKTLDLSKNPALTKLNCLENPIKKLDLSNNTNLSAVSLPETATVTLPGGDKIAMGDFKITKGKDGKLHLDLSRFGEKIGTVSAEPEGPDEVSVEASDGVFSFAPFGGRLIVPYCPGGDSVGKPLSETAIDIILYVDEEL